jgi:hypothetical protein
MTLLASGRPEADRSRMNATGESFFITRGEVLLGQFPAAEVRELLGSGLLHPTDLFRRDAGEPVRPLSEFPAATESVTATTTARLTKAVLEVADNLGRTARAAAGAIAGGVTRQHHELAAGTQRLLEDFLPRLREPVARALARTSHTFESALRDEAFLRKLFGAVYDLLPRPVCRFVGEEQFITFCLKHRERLLTK